MYVCMCVCVCVCVCGWMDVIYTVCVCVCMYVCMYLWMDVIYVLYVLYVYVNLVTMRGGQNWLRIMSSCGL